MISSDSEVYSYVDQIRDLDDYIKFMREKNVSPNLLFNRFRCLLETYFINISEFLPSNLDPLILIVETEKQLNIHPNGRKWENFKIDVKEEIKKNFTEKYKIHRDFQIKMELMANEYLKENYLNLENVKIKGLVEKYFRQMDDGFGKIEDLGYVWKKLFDEEEIFQVHNFRYKVMKIERINFKYESLQLNNWKDFFIKKTNNEEIEIRFQYITGIEFGNVFQYCLKNTDIMFHINRFSLVNRENINETLQQRTYNFINDNDELPFHQTKETLDVKYNNYWNFKVVKSLEKNVLDLTYKNPDKFYKNSFSFYSRPKLHPLHNFILDMSVTLDISNKANSFPKIKYRIELEKRRDGIYTEEILKEAVLFILKLMQNVKNDYELIDSNIKNDIYKIINYPKSFVNKVIPFQINQKSILEFLETKYYVTNKLDGERVILFIDTKKGVFLIYLDGTKKRILNSFSVQNPFNFRLIFDCELFNNELNIFDLITYNTKFENRLTLINTYIPFLNSLFKKIKEYKFAIKDYIKVKSMKDIGVMYDNMLLTKNLDGIILQPNDYNYKTSTPIKLKPPKLNTLDIIIKNPLHNDPINFEEEINLNLERTTKYLEYDFNILLFVAEVINIKNKYYPIKIRFEKDYGNPEKVLKSNDLLTRLNIKDIINGKGITIAKKVINYYKQNILNKLKGVLVDVGSGQGGDINKWEKFSKIFAIERDDNMVKIFQERQKNSSANIKLIHSNFEDVEIDEPIDYMTIFFSVNSICKSKESLTKFVKKIKEINPIEIHLLFNEYNKLKAIQSEYLKINELDHGYIITIENTFVENILEYEFNLKAFVKELGYFDNVVKLDNHFDNLSDFENNFLKTVKYIKFTKNKVLNFQQEYDKYDYSNEFVDERNNIDKKYNNQNSMDYYEEKYDIDDEDENKNYDIDYDSDESLKSELSYSDNLVYDFSCEIEKENPVVEVFNIEFTKAKLDNIKQFWPVPSENTNLLINQNEIKFKEFLDNVSFQKLFGPKTNEYFWQLLDVFSKGNFTNYDIFTSFNPFTFLFQNIIGQELKFSNHNLIDILYHPDLMNTPTTNKKIFIGFFNDIPKNWSDSILIIVNEISIEIINYLSKYNKIIIYRTFLVPGMVYECHEMKGIEIPERINGLLESTNNLITMTEHETIIIPKSIEQIKIFKVIFINTSFNIKCFYNLLINSDCYKYFKNNDDIKHIHKNPKNKNKNPFPNVSGFNDEFKELNKKGYKISTINHGYFAKDFTNYDENYLIIYNKKNLFNSKYLIKLNIDISKHNKYFITSEYIENIKGEGEDIYIFLNNLGEQFIVREHPSLTSIKNIYNNKNGKYFFEQFFKDENLNPGWYQNFKQLANYKLIGFVISDKPIKDDKIDENNLYFRRFNKFYKYTKEGEILEIKEFPFDTIPYLALYQK